PGAEVRLPGPDGDPCGGERLCRLSGPGQAGTAGHAAAQPGDAEEDALGLRGGLVLRDSVELPGDGGRLGLGRQSGRETARGAGSPAGNEAEGPGADEEPGGAVARVQGLQPVQGRAGRMGSPGPALDVAGHVTCGEVLAHAGRSRDPRGTGGG